MKYLFIRGVSDYGEEMSSLYAISSEDLKLIRPLISILKELDYNNWEKFCLNEDYINREGVMQLSKHIPSNSQTGGYAKTVLEFRVLTVEKEEIL